MTVTADPSAAMAAPAPGQYVVPRVHGDPTAARRLAASYRVLADDVTASARVAAQVMAGLSPTWRGTGHRASAHPAEVVQHNATATARSLQQAADALDAYAHKLETAHSHHFFSLHRLMAVATVVTITAVAVVVTMGAAAAAEAALAAGAAGEATAAASAAAAASEGAAAGLLQSTAGLVGLRALLSFAVPHLVQAELSAGFAASTEEGADGHLDWHEIGTAAGAGFAGSAGAAQAGRIAESVKFAKETWPLLHALLPHLGQAAAWGAVDAGQQVASGGQFSMRELLLTSGLAGVGSAMPSMRVKPTLGGAAYLDRQTADELASGVQLSCHEGDGLGHTLAKHVNVTDADLATRIATENRKQASRFLDRATAEHAVTVVLRDNLEKLMTFARSEESELRLRGRLTRPVGVVMDRALQLSVASQVVVRLARDTDGIFILTAYPELPRR